MNKEQVEEKATEAFDKLEKELDDIEERLCKGMLDFGANQHDIDEMRPWLHHTIREQTFRLLSEKIGELEVTAVCFTGHRPEKIGGYNENNSIAQGIKSELLKQIITLSNDGVTDFISGGALGVDTWAAEAVLEAKKTNPSLRLIIAKPFPSQDNKWLQESKDRFKAFCDAADEVVDVNPDPYAVWKMQARNAWMVDHADLVLAIWDGSNGGTGNCVKYAKDKGKQIMVIHPISRQIKNY